MKNKKLIKISAILLCIGIIFIIISWILSYPIHLTETRDLTFSQFFPSIWPGMILSSIALFSLGYSYKKKYIQALCSALFPIILYAYTFFFSYVPSSDCGNVRGMFYVFQKTGINSDVIPYFDFPNYFTYNEIIHQIVHIDENMIAALSIIIYGILLGLFLYLFLDHQKNKFNKELKPFILTITYFIGMYSFLNFQWVPQTLALVYFFILLFITSRLTEKFSHKYWEFILLFVFVAFFFTHAFLPVIFLLFFALIILKRRSFFSIFIILSSFFIVFTLYYLNIYLSIYIQTFQQSIAGFSQEYISVASRSFGETMNLLSTIISYANRIRIPLIWLLGFIGSLILLYKKKIHTFFISLGLSGGFYLAVGTLFSVLGLRATQIFFIPLSNGLTYFFTRWKKPMMLLFLVLLILSVFGPMRIAYDTTQFHTYEEAEICNFLADTSNNRFMQVALSQSNNGYFKTVYKYLKDNYPVSLRPGNSEFLTIYKENMTKNQYIISNTNLEKEIIIYSLTEQELNKTLIKIQTNNKIIDNGNTSILKGFQE